MSPFSWKDQPSKIDTRALNRSTINQMSSTATVERKRRKGGDPGTISGLSKVEQPRHGGAYLRYKKPAK